MTSQLILFPTKAVLLSVDDWKAWFDRQIGTDLHRYARRRWKYNQPLWELIEKKLPAGGTILECGCGAGVYSSLLSLWGYKVTGIDIDESVLEMGRRCARELGALGMEFERGDIFDLSPYYGRFSLAYSSGVLEHFPLTEASQILREEARCAPYVLVAVPSKRIKEFDIDVFRYPHTITSLRKVFHDAGLEVTEEFGFSTSHKVGRVIETFLPPWAQKRTLKYFASTLVMLGKSTSFEKCR